MDVDEGTHSTQKRNAVLPKFKPVDVESLAVSAFVNMYLFFNLYWYQFFSLQNANIEFRKIIVPQNRKTPLKQNWLKIFTPVVEHLNLQMRFNVDSSCVEIRTYEGTKDKNSIQKAADFLRAFILGFEVEDALALIRLDEMFLETFEIQDGTFLFI